MIAALPMYARPQNRAAHDALWALIRDELRDRDIAAPDLLDHDIAYDAPWSRDDLVLGHICNLPYRAAFRDKVTIIGAPNYGLPETPLGYYRSVYIVRADDPAQSLDDTDGYHYALNDPLSQSGWGAAFAHAQADGRVLTPALITGAHTASLRAVAGGQADLASIDAQSWWMDGALPEALTCRIIGRTPASPGMTFVTAGTIDPTPYFDAIAAGIAGLPADHAQMLGLRGIVRLPASAYDLPMPDTPRLPLAATL